MNPSKLTDEELWLAIAEIIAKKNGWIIHRAVGIGAEELCYWRDEQLIDFIPNYTSDNNAALGLLDEFAAYQIYKGEDKWGDPVYWVCPTKDNRVVNGPISKILARAISEAWLMVRRNDG